ncbi:TonB-dependent siderophore receptor [Rheinheimera sp.]|uniref:TonB-dependent receptor n=1 Tax=Rheinheimera sp. TaxID=1869214 RepID=UPI002636F1A5|nr:TonB-dependent receptor [Rheinheimera sp.]MCA1928367.1 TonB-dependent receptor [Rheinheimera sp.]
MQLSRIPRLSLLSLACAQALSLLCFSAVAKEQSQVNTAAEASLERLSVFGQRTSDTFGSKSGILLKELPQSIQLLDVEQMRGQGLVSVGDLLRDIPSANPGYSRVGPYQSFSLKIRGFAADQMRNGMRQRYFEDVDASALNSIERMEVLKGPSGVLYGQSAVGGVINLVSKTPGADNSGSAGLRLGTDQQRVANGDISKVLSDSVSLRLTGELERSDTFVDRQPMDRNNISLMLQHQVGDQATGHFVAEYVKRETDRYVGLPVSVVLPDQDEEVLDISSQLGEPGFTSLRSFAPLYQYWLDIQLTPDWTLTPRLQYQEFNTVFGQVNLRAPVVGKPELISRTGRQGRENDDYQIAQLDLNGRVMTGALEHKVLLGYEAGRERGRFTQSNIRAGTLNPVDINNPQYQYDSQDPVLDFAFDNFYNLDSDAWYLQDQIKFTPDLHLIGAVRYTDSKAGSGSWGSRADWVPVSSTIWQLGLTWQLNDQLTLFTGHNTGFDVESSAAARSRTGDALEPEESAQTELGLRFSAEQFNGSLALFRIERLNALTADPLDSDFSVNSGEQRVDGVEMEGRWQLNSALQLQAGYAYMDGQITESNDGDLGAKLGDLARHRVNLSANWQYNDDWTAFVRANYSSGRPLVTGSSWQLDAYRLIGAGLRYQQSNWSAQLAVNNLLDELYYTASGNGFVVYPGEPQQASLQLIWQW